MKNKLRWGLLLALAALVALWVALGPRRASTAEADASQTERQQFRRLLGPQPNALRRIEAPATELSNALGTASAVPVGTAACQEFYRRLFSEDFSSIEAERMNRLPPVGGCVPERPMAKSVVESYRAACGDGSPYPKAYADWTSDQKQRATQCLLWVWFLRSGVLAERMKDENPGNVADAATLSQWLFGAFLSNDFERLPALAERLVEVDPASVLGAKAGLMKPLTDLGQTDASGEAKLDEAFWVDAEREWSRARELAPGDRDVEFAGIMIRTRNMELPRLKRELEERQSAYGTDDSLGAYLSAYYVSKTASKEAAASQLEAAAKRFPSDAQRFQKAAQSCRTKAKCEFELTYNIEAKNLLRIDDIIH